MTYKEKSELPQPTRIFLWLNNNFHQENETAYSSPKPWIPYLLKVFLKRKLSLALFFAAKEPIPRKGIGSFVL